MSCQHEFGSSFGKCALTFEASAKIALVGFFPLLVRSFCVVDVRKKIPMKDEDGNYRNRPESAYCFDNEF